MHFTYSSLLGRTTYIGFFVDWLIQVATVLAAFVAIVLSVVSYVGLFLYINGMVDDLKMRMGLIEDNSSWTTSSLSQNKLWSTYVQAIDFHVEVLGYARKSLTSTLFRSNFFKFFFCNSQHRRFAADHDEHDFIQSNSHVYNRHCFQLIRDWAEWFVKFRSNHCISEYGQYAWNDIRLLLFIRVYYTAFAGHRRLVLWFCMVSIGW